MTRVVAGVSITMGRMDFPSMPGGRSRPARLRKVGVKSTLEARKSKLEPGVMPGPLMSRWMRVSKS